MPVHRIGKGQRSPVYAVIAELKFWLATSAGKSALCMTRAEPNQRDSTGSKREHYLAGRLHQLAHALAQASVRHQTQAEALERNILALRSRINSRRSALTNMIAFRKRTVLLVDDEESLL